MAAMLLPSPHHLSNLHHASLAAHGDQRHYEDGEVSDDTFYNLLCYPSPHSANGRPSLTSRLMAPVNGRVRSNSNSSSSGKLNDNAAQCGDDLSSMLPVALQPQSSSDLPWVSPALTITTSFPSSVLGSGSGSSLSVQPSPLGSSVDTSSYFVGAGSTSLPLWSPPALQRSVSFASSLLIENNESDDAAAVKPSPSPAAPLSTPHTVVLPNPWASSSDALPAAYTGMIKRELSSNRDAFDAIAPEFDASHDPLPEIYTDMELPYVFVAPVAAPQPTPSATTAVTPQLNFEYAQTASTTVLGAIPASPLIVAAAAPADDAAGADNDFALNTPMSPETEIDEELLVPPAAFVPTLSAPAPVASTAPATAAPAAPTAPAPLKFVTSLPARGAKAKAARAKEEARLSEAKEEPREPYTPGVVRAVPSAGSGPLAAVRGPLASVGVYTREERRAKIERYKAKRRARLPAGAPLHPRSGGQYACRKSFADRRPRIAGRFVKMDDETKKYLSLTKPGAAQPAPVDLVPPPAIVAWTQASQLQQPPQEFLPPAPAFAGAAAFGGARPGAHAPALHYSSLASTYRATHSASASYPPAAPMYPSSHAYAPYVQPLASDSSSGVGSSSGMSFFA